jgi:DNA-nicking Smr family endonuclease
MTEEESELWRHATRQLAPIQIKQRVSGQPEPLSPPARKAGGQQASGSTLPPARGPASSKPAAVEPPALAEFDQRRARRIASGRIAIDGRLDLHGLRQRDARAQLRSFLFDAYAKGHRVVLVITGKGNTSPNVESQSSLLDETPRGVLRQAVPAWLQEPELRSIVSGFTAAGIRHGGNGALYVQLRKPARSA